MVGRPVHRATAEPDRFDDGDDAEWTADQVALATKNETVDT